MHSVYFYHEDKNATERNSIGLLFVRDEKSPFDVLFECPEYSSFFRSIIDDIPQQEVLLKKPSIVPLTLSDLCRVGLIDLVDGVMQIDRDRRIYIRFK